MVTTPIFPIFALLFGLQASGLPAETAAPQPSASSSQVSNHDRLSEPSRSAGSGCIALLRIQTRAYLQNVIEKNRIEGLSASAATWRSEFLRKFPEYSNLPQEELLRISHEVLAWGEAYIETISSIGRLSLVQYINTGGQIVQKFRLPAVLEGLEGAYNDTALAIDYKTKAIDANTPEGFQLANAFVQNAPHGTIVIFTDLNFLGKVNYFAKEYEAGDNYLIAFGEAMRENLRLGKGGDLMLKIGGDEFVLLLPVRDSYLDRPTNVQAFLDRIVRSVHQSRAAKEVFTEQQRALARDYRRVNIATKFSELSDELLRSFFGNEWESLRDSMSFDKFQSMFLELQLKKIRDHSRYAASVSVGGAIVLPGGTYRDGLLQARSDASAFKILYKTSLGLMGEVTKYGVYYHSPHNTTFSSEEKKEQSSLRRKSDKIPSTFIPKEIKPSQ